MFVLTTLVYPVVLAALCIGTGLLVDRCSGGWLPGLLLPAAGAAGLIGLSQLATFLAPIAPATPWVMTAVAVAGVALARPRLRVLAGRLRERPWQPVAPVLAYLLALAPVLLSGRPSFSAYLTLSDSAVHMTGADYLLHHGQAYGHLDLRNSYGQYINDYYNTSYPSGADTLFGGSSFLSSGPSNRSTRSCLRSRRARRGCWCVALVWTGRGPPWQHSPRLCPRWSTAMS